MHTICIQYLYANTKLQYCSSQGTRTENRCSGKKEYRNRSELIREAARVYLERRMEWDELFVYGKGVGKKMGITSEDDVNKIVWDYRHGKNQ